MSVYVTADLEGNFKYIEDFCKKFNTTTDDILIILGDAGINYDKSAGDYYTKKNLSKLPITLFCIHGNHEERPENITGYKYDFNNKVQNVVWYETSFPNILFARDDTFYWLEDKFYYVLGGAYSVDKFYRITMGRRWFASEQNEMLKQTLHRMLDEKPELVWIRYSKAQRDIECGKYPTILTHTCPYKYRPVEAFLPQIDQSTVDTSMEELLDRIEEKMPYKKWLCGHFHIQKKIDKIHFLYRNILQLS